MSLRPAEKALKAVLAIRGFEIPRTHDLDLLTRLIARGPDELPDELGDAKLSLWAVATRYDEIDTRVRDRAGPHDKR